MTIFLSLLLLRVHVSAPPVCKLIDPSQTSDVLKCSILHPYNCVYHMCRLLLYKHYTRMSSVLGHRLYWPAYMSFYFYSYTRSESLIRIRFELGPQLNRPIFPAPFFFS